MSSNKTHAALGSSALSAAALGLMLTLGSASAWSAAPGASARGAGAASRPSMPARASRPSLPDRASRPDAAAHRGAPADRPEAASQRGSARTVIERTDTGMTRTTTVTNGQGETKTSSTTITRDPETGTRSVEVQRTGFDGSTSSVSSTTQRTEDGARRTTTVTNPEGQTMTRELTISRDAEGNRVVEGTATGFDGQTRTISRTAGQEQEEPSGE